MHERETEKCDENCDIDKRVNDLDYCVIDELLVAEKYKDDRQVENCCGRFRNDRKYRGRLCHTACTTWAMISFGITQTIIGLAFPDLMLIINKDVGDASWIFTAWSFGNMFGSLTAGFAYERMNKLAVLITLSVGLAIMTGVTPWCTGYPVMLCVHLLGGSFGNAIHSTVTADTIFLWKEQKATFLQIVHLAATSGGIFSPFFVKPFLKYQHFGTNDSKIFQSNNSGYSPYRNNTTDTVEGHGETFRNGGTQIQYAYLLAAGFTFIAVIFYVLSYLIYGNVYINDGEKQASYSVK